MCVRVRISSVRFQDDAIVRGYDVIDGVPHTLLEQGPVLGVQDVARGGKM